MALYSKDVDPAFEASGAKPGLDIWCVENLRLVRLPKSFYGKFYSGNAYVVLNTVLPKNGVPQFEIHYWLGKDVNEEESVLASDKALELDFALGSCAVQYKEVQGQETERFLSYFKPCIIPIEGFYSSALGRVEGGGYKVSLLTCKGDHVASVKEVPFSRTSLNHDDVFILDTASKIFLFSGCNSSIQERAKALEVVQYIKDNKHGGNCEVATIEDGKFVGDPDVGEFWSLFGGYAPIPKDSPSSNKKQSDTPPLLKLFWITTQGKLCPCEVDSLRKELLESNKCYMLDCVSEIFIWMGRNTSVTERKTSISAIEDFLRNKGRENKTHLAFLTEGLETPVFRSHFQNWPQVVETKLYEEGREKVAAIFKQHGYDVKEIPDEEDYEAFINCRGKLKVWRVDGDEVTLLPLSDQTKLFSGDCYIVQYTYSAGIDKNLFYAWFGRESISEDRVDAISHMNAIMGTTKGDPVWAQVVQDKEPVLFFLILQRVITFKGGLSKQYKEFIAENGVLDETYDYNKTALFRVQGTSPENMQAIQVDQVSSSLNSSYCYILRSGESTFTWFGNSSSTVDHDLLDRMLELINQTWQPISVREGSESDVFWDALGGKTDYPKEKEIKRHVEEPNLFSLAFTDGDLKGKEIYSFTQDDLTTEDVLMLDCHEEIFVWVGLHSNVKSKQQALDYGKKFLVLDPLSEGLSSETPIYIVTEGHELPFFTRFFEWDSSKANMHGNSFERKLAILKGNQKNLEVPARYLRKAPSRGSTPDGLRSRSITLNGRGNSPSPASNGSGSSFISSNNHVFASPSPTARKLFTASPNGSTGSTTTVTSSPPQSSAEADDTDISTPAITYRYEQLKVNSIDPAPGINVTKREAYLSNEEFEEKFAMNKSAFYRLPKWRQNKLKMSLNLF